MPKNKIKQYRISAGLSQEELAIKSGLSRNSIHKYEQENFIPKISAQYKISAALNIPKYKLIEWDINEFECNDTFNFKIKNSLDVQPEYVVRVLLGLPTNIMINVSSYTESKFAFKQDDASMIGAGISPGDILFANSTKCFESGDLILMSYNDTPMIRKIIFDNDKILYIPENKEYEILYRNKTEDIQGNIREWGKIVYIAKKI